MPGPILAIIDNAKADLARVTTRLVDKQITSAAWERECANILRRNWAASYIAGMGREPTKAEWREMQQELNRQGGYLRRFREEYDAGKLSAAQTANRILLYGDRLWGNYEVARAISAGIELPQYPGDGNTECLTNCRCHLEYEDVFDGKGNKKAVLVTWVLDPDPAVEHCEDCQELAVKWNPLRVPVVAKGWVTLHDKQGEPYRVLIDGEESRQTQGEKQEAQPNQINPKYRGKSAEYADERIKDAAARFHIDEKTVEQNCSAYVAGFMQKAELSVRLPGDIVAQVVEDGRIKNQHESGTSGGAFDPSFRSEAERNAFLITGDKPGDFPIYGYFHHPDFGSGQAHAYGDARLVLNDDVRGRTTYTVGDSLGGFYDGTTLPCGVGDVSKSNWDGHLQELLVEHDTGRNARVPGGYFEAQIHGGIKLNDIKYVEMIRPEYVRTGHQKSYDKAIAALRAKGIKVRIRAE